MWEKIHFYEDTFVDHWRYLRWNMKVSSTLSVFRTDITDKKSILTNSYSVPNCYTDPVPNCLPNPVPNCLPDPLYNCFPDPVDNCFPNPVDNCLPDPVGIRITEVQWRTKRCKKAQRPVLSRAGQGQYTDTNVVPCCFITIRSRFHMKRFKWGLRWFDGICGDKKWGEKDKLCSD